jgi:predicted amidohydrolase
LQTTTTGIGLTILGTNKTRAQSSVLKPKKRQNRLPREVWIATVSQNRMEASSVEEMSRKMLARMKEVLPFEPDIICLPEVFPFVNLAQGRPPVAEAAEVPIGAISRPFADFARQNHCHVVCPVYTRHEGRFYNTAVFIDDQGQLLGEYHKIHPTIGEMDSGIEPGPLQAPVFDTRFGKIGAQICFDMQWNDGWESLQRAGAEIVFWPSAFGGGTLVNTRAWQHHTVVVSSTRKDTSKICDITGQEVARTGHWDQWVCGPVNLEKGFVHTWPYCRSFPDIKAKYGRSVRIQNFHEEEWSILESLSPDVRIADVLQEFEIKTHAEHIGAAHKRQLAERG